MIINAYVLNLAVLVGLLGWASYSRAMRQRKRTPVAMSESMAAADEETAAGEEEPKGPDAMAEAKWYAFRNRFLRVYVLAVGADWLQGSFIYSLYKNTHQLPEPTIAALFATGFVCGAISATFVGSLADRFGRKLACMLYCIIYSVSCLTVLSANPSVLFFGRALGGVSTTLLFTTFDAWLVAEIHRLGFDGEDRLSAIFGEMSMANGFVAIACGVVSQVLVQVFGSEKAPFIGSVVVLICAFVLISRYWPENYGVSHDGGAQTSKSSTLATLSDARLLAISFAACFFEGSMYIMVFYWSEALISAHGSPDLPFGLIFANFMSAMSLGSLGFARMTQDANSVQRSSQAIQLALAVAASSLSVVVLVKQELVRFWALCVFEACLGMYFPSMAYLKGNVIGDEHRGRIYGFMRLPLNVFVVSALGSVKEGDAFRDNIFMVCSSFILVSTLGMAKYVRG
ncbi:related to major facilitator superfamily domain-containing protein 5 [Cephalotrichum gorgonifer]|uniref:Molybdate-anion transporter n=1 Tax=Cephalotrichum gorgonifer TaxID=2041049 RepID=A0AAE8SZI5_9PEZI|nr:related to major facilitator superfamily domain-containing protein 5 [Cephalotrichum gorgonifer]